MKKTTIVFTLLLLSFFAGKAQIVLQEDFSSGEMPPAGWTISAFSGNWSAASSSNAGGQSPEARLTWTPQFTGQSYLVSPSMDLLSNSTGSLLISFRHMLDHYGGNYTIGLAVRTMGGAWSPVWQVINPSANISAQQQNIVLDSDAATSRDVQLGFFFSGNSFNMNDWYIDDIQVIIPASFDLALSSIDVTGLIADPVPVTGTVTNMGLEVIESFDLNWQLDDGSVQTTSISGLSLDFNDQYVFEAEQLLDAEPGSYELTVFITNINGQPSDDNPENNTLSQTVSVVYGQVQRRPLFEMFTSSTCPPCATFNNGFFNSFASNNAEQMTLIKYQMNWPGSGDPYYTPEGGVRRTYYGVNAVPMLYLEGNNIATNGTVVTQGLQQALQIPAYVDISGYFDVQGTTITISGSLMPYADFDQVRLHVVVIEGVTTGNVGSNGETHFHHVMHKMLPNAQGTSISLNALEAHPFEHTFNMATTNVEDMDDLKVVVFLQNNASREVYQSAYLQEGVPEFVTVTFSVLDANGNAIPDAVVTLNGVANEPGDYVFEQIESGTHAYTVSSPCYEDAAGEVVVGNQNIEHQAVLNHSMSGDANGDGIVNVLDVITIVNYFSESFGGLFCFANADVNNDGLINVLDVIATVAIFSADK
ncbi:MAG: Omp28-related outer membrane protein [Bacteroidales bacterium]|nr:Omp28-related outer membrane protein [Bacteroidales bacterium]